MTVAIPVWDDGVSTAFDFARKLLVVEVDGKREVSRKELPLDDEPAEKNAGRIRDLAVQVVICGAISQPLAQAVSQAGIEIIPYVSGQVDSVLAAYLCGRLADPRFLQPGSRPGARKRRRPRSGFRGDLNGCGEARAKGGDWHASW